MKASPAFPFAGFVYIAAGGLSWAQNLTLPEESSSQQAQGAQIGWASLAFQTNLMADGVTTFEESSQQIFFQLGTFKAGFDPVTATPDQWAENWIVLQSTAYDTGDSQFIQTATVTSNATPFLENARAYVWGFSSQDKTDEGSQWVVMTADNWIWPASTASQPVTFSTGDLTVTALLGTVNYNPAAGGFHMQFDYAVVPEPSSPVLAGIAAFGLVWRRRR